MDRSKPKESNRDPYRSVVIVLLAVAVLGAVGAIIGGLQLSNPVLLNAALTLGLSAGVLAGVATAQAMRLRPPHRAEVSLTLELEAAAPEAAEADGSKETEAAAAEGASDTGPNLRIAEELRSRFITVSRRMALWYRGGEALVRIRRGVAVAGAIAIWFLLRMDTSGFPPYLVPAALAAALCLIAAGIAATAVRYLGEIEPAHLPESPALRRGARAVAWILVLAALSMGVAFADWRTALRILFYAVVAVNAAICYGLFTIKSPSDSAVFPLDIGVLSVLGSRNNILASILDSAERQLGIDLRSTWALAVVRRSLEPLLLGLCLIGWLSTSLTVVGIEEKGLVERLGVPVGGAPLSLATSTPNRPCQCFL
jgi:hypothetical protein